MIQIFLIILSIVVFALAHLITKTAKEEKQIKKYIEKILPIFAAFNIAVLFKQPVGAALIAICIYLILQYNINNTKKYVVISAALIAITLASNNAEFYYFALTTLFLTGINSYLQNKYKNLWVETTLLALSTLLIYSTIILIL